MGTIESENALLLDTVDPITADLAVSLLKEAEIPALKHGPDFDVAELGSAAHASARGVSVFVPKAALAAAKKVIEDAWGKEGLPPVE